MNSASSAATLKIPLTSVVHALMVTFLLISNGRAVAQLHNLENNDVHVPVIMIQTKNLEAYDHTRFCSSSKPIRLCGSD